MWTKIFGRNTDNCNINWLFIFLGRIDWLTLIVKDPKQNLHNQILVFSEATADCWRPSACSDESFTALLLWHSVFPRRLHPHRRARFFLAQYRHLFHCSQILGQGSTWSKLNIEKGWWRPEICCCWSLSPSSSRSIDDEFRLYLQVMLVFACFLIVQLFILFGIWTKDDDDDQFLCWWRTMTTMVTFLVDEGRSLLWRRWSVFLGMIGSMYILVPISINELCLFRFPTGRSLHFYFRRRGPLHFYSNQRWFKWEWAKRPCPQTSSAEFCPMTVLTRRYPCTISSCICILASCICIFAPCICFFVLFCFTPDIWPARLRICLLALG